MGQCYDKWSVDNIIITDIKLTIMFVFATLVIDWFQIKNENSKDRNLKK